MSIALIDGDEIAYKVSLKYQRKLYGVYRESRLLWSHPTKLEAIESVGNEQDLDIQPYIEVFPITYNDYKERIEDYINTILNDTNCSDYVVLLSGKNNIRYNLATLQPYKGNRDDSTKPKYLFLIKEYLESLGAKAVDHLEADDLLVVEYLKNPDSIICSTDKDLRTVPSINYNISTREIKTISKELSLYNFYTQMLTGDSVDNIPSPFGLGIVASSKILDEIKGSEDEKEYYNTILEPYQSFLDRKDKQGNYKTKWYSGQDIHEILWEVGNLLWMRRTVDPDERWNPPI